MKVTVERTIAFPLDTVWALLDDFGNIEWSGNPGKVEIIGSGVGMIRRIIIKGMDPIDEILDYKDASNYRYGYSIPKGLPMPISGYKAEVNLASIGDDDDDSHTSVSFSCNAEPDGVSEDEARAIMDAMYNQIIDWIEAALAS